jgi:hypothetical protein
VQCGEPLGICFARAEELTGKAKQGVDDATADECGQALKRSLANLLARTAASLTAAVKNRLKRMQYRTATGLSPPTPKGL